MKVELHRHTANGKRSISLTSSDTADRPETIRDWIKMLYIAERWLKAGKEEAK